MAALAQGSSTVPQHDSLASPRDRVAQDPSDGHAWAALGRTYLGLLTADRGTRADTVWAYAVLDSADHALARAGARLGPVGVNPEGDSARVLRVQVWSERALIAWEVAGFNRGIEVWGPVPLDLRLSPVLQELGENLLRACPPHGVLLTAGASDSYGAWYMRYVRGLRPDILVVPLAVWRGDPGFRTRAATGLYQHGVRTAARPRSVDSAAARMGCGSACRRQPRSSARLRVRRAQDGAGRSRPLGPKRPRAICPGRAQHTGAVRRVGDVQRCGCEHRLPAMRLETSAA